MKESTRVTPRIIIHGGAGNITRENLTKDAYSAYKTALLSILQSSYELLVQQEETTALDVATHAVALLEDNALFNAGHGAVFTTAETHELEASIMVSTGYRKRGVGVMQVSKAKNPIKLARALLVQGEEADGGGAAGHVQLTGKTADMLAENWGLQLVSPGYYWTKRRWDEHRKGIGKGTDEAVYQRHKRRADELSTCSPCTCVAESGALVGHGGVDSRLHDPSWDGREYLPQGTVGAVVLDSNGTLCVATSTGGMTNKLPGRIGDTPTIGAGFWAEQWIDEYANDQSMQYKRQPVPSPASRLANGEVTNLLHDCLPFLSFSSPHPAPHNINAKALIPPFYNIHNRIHSVALSGTGNGDSFLKVNAARTAAALTRFCPLSRLPSPSLPLHKQKTSPLALAVSRVVGPNGMLQSSAEDRWKQGTGEGEGGMIGIEFVRGEGLVVADFNCGGMFRAWMDEEGEGHVLVFREEY